MCELSKLDPKASATYWTFGKHSADETSHRAYLDKLDEHSLTHVWRERRLRNDFHSSVKRLYNRSCSHSFYTIHKYSIFISCSLSRLIDRLRLHQRSPPSQILATRRHIVHLHELEIKHQWQSGFPLIVYKWHPCQAEELFKTSLDTHSRNI